eukprot:CAMPEP_0177214042 /NCGR_PEP_ID=MMETSP0367-20130122/33485_1 /TAXON_ID=447022 ORGANISM="Scrippsiella hangoei-like, Strain SHHI-4" /NCGR_SAMPLE_ID=MMETSP0367 /ASSEMBLY_ACC=CAM_ASM_000362 /LENGTH=46 /DNA_ID= /DNA_START= /DNA_END= /DNA_ORIENTATION=
MTRLCKNADLGGQHPRKHDVKPEHNALKAGGRGSPQSSSWSHSDLA